MSDGHRSGVCRTLSAAQMERSKVHGCGRGVRFLGRMRTVTYRSLPSIWGWRMTISELPPFIGQLGEGEIVVIQKILHENDATEEQMKKLFEEERMRKRDPGSTWRKQVMSSAKRSG